MRSHLANLLVYVDTTNPKPRELETVCGGVRFRYAFVVWLLFLIGPPKFDDMWFGEAQRASAHKNKCFK